MDNTSQLIWKLDIHRLLTYLLKVEIKHFLHNLFIIYRREKKESESKTEVETEEREEEKKESRPERIFFENKGSSYL